MKRYKNGKIIDTPKEEVEKIHKRFEKHRGTKRPSFTDHEVRIKALEEAMATLLAKQNVEEPTNEN